MSRHTCCVVLLYLLFAPAASAQGLLFSLPEDGTGVEYEGQLLLETIRPDLEDGLEELQWTRSLIIKSVGREDAEYKGELQPCRWIEIKSVTGTAGAGGIDSGVVGARVYKILVPESRVISSAADATGIPNSVLPIVKGYRRLGEEAAEPIRSKGLIVYPTVSLLANYVDPEVVADSEEVASVGGQDLFDAQHLKGRLVQERRDARSTNTADYWISRQIPFGLAGWSVKVVREVKRSTEDRSTFRQLTTVSCDMKVLQILDTVESELTVGGL